MGEPAAARRRRLMLAAAAAPLAALAAGRAGATPLVEVIAAIKGSVLPVGVFNPTAAPRFAFRGTGFVVGDGNHLATNYHVLPANFDKQDGPVIAVLADRRSEATQLRAARVVATDRAHDMALLRFDGEPLKPLALADPETRVREGQAIALVGFPIGGTLGFAPVAHRGIVASVTTVALPAPTAGQLDPRAVARLRDGNFQVFQLDATAYPGNSGGPVVDADTGTVLAVVNMVLVKGSRESALSSPTGISYAIPVRHLHKLLAGR